MFEDTTTEAVVEAVVGVEGLYVVRIPLPVRLEPVNCYLGLDDNGRATIVDAGLALGAGAVWRAALDALGIAPSDVQRVIVTHFHPDHIGGSGVLQQLTGADVFASPLTVEQTPGVWGDVAAYDAKMVAHLRAHGMPQARIDQLASEVDITTAAVALPDALRPMDLEQPLHFASGTWHPILTPGHSDGHVCLHDADRRVLIAGDHLLERISPAVGRFPDHSEDPLASYLDSLRATSRLDIDLVLPGHGRPFSDAAGRCRELLEHHELRVAACLDAIPVGGSSAHDVALEVFGDQHDAASERFALTETVAHLEYARARGRVTCRRSRDGGLRWLEPGS